LRDEELFEPDRLDPLRLELLRELDEDFRLVVVRFAPLLRPAADRLPDDLLRDVERPLDDFFAADPRFVDEARFFGGPMPLSRALFSAIAIACFCAFFLLAGLLLPIEPFRSYECISSRMLLLIVPRLDPFFIGMMSLLYVIPTGASSRQHECSFPFPFARPMLGAPCARGLSENQQQRCRLLPTIRERMRGAVA
jgi:hypothetical protein